MGQEKNAPVLGQRALQHTFLKLFFLFFNTRKTPYRTRKTKKNPRKKKRRPVKVQHVYTRKLDNQYPPLSPRKRYFPVNCRVRRYGPTVTISRAMTPSAGDRSGQPVARMPLSRGPPQQGQEHFNIYEVYFLISILRIRKESMSHAWKWTRLLVTKKKSGSVTVTANTCHSARRTGWNVFCSALRGRTKKK